MQLEFFPGQLETVLRRVPMMNAVNTTAADGPEEIQAPAPRVPATPPHRLRGERRRKGGFRSFLLLRSCFNSSLFALCSTPFSGFVRRSTRVFCPSSGLGSTPNPQLSQYRRVFQRSPRSPRGPLP
ncbi:hypothetical protein HMPREF9440_00170 [Sutterella parvirubra YIT 11816]|uniref:Uncharacterized protein n=1 Tax=Sutterella parvirubra YIT 11816 TaxID=762967 RepID=H3KBS4_9BURK|nr:hypothetical protein HMPREF9440_00170 [Sutterella parvirubra YIT 11816]